MLIREWMTKVVVTVTPETSMMKASKIMKEKGVRRLPVLDSSNRVVGIVSDRDIKEASPSKATTLDMHELYYLLSEVKVKNIMTPDPVVVRADQTVETVALLLVERHIGGVPVVDEDNKIIGIISDSDLFKIMIQITGVRNGGVQFTFAVEEGHGRLKPIIDLLSEMQASIDTILTSATDRADGSRHVHLRIMPMDRAEENRVIEAVTAKVPSLLYWARKQVHEVNK